MFIVATVCCYEAVMRMGWAKKVTALTRRTALRRSLSTLVLRTHTTQNNTSTPHSSYSIQFKLYILYLTLL
jgi:hypothetical protein